VAWEVLALPGPQGPAGPPGVASATAPLALSSGNLSIDLSAYLTTSTAASTYLTQSNASSTYQPISGMSSYLTTSSAASTYQPLSGMSSYLTTSAAASTYYPLSSNPAGYLTSAPVTSVAGRTGAVTLAVADVSGAAPTASPTFTGLATFDNGNNFSIIIPNGVGFDTRIESNVYSMRNSGNEVIRIGANGIKYPDGITQTVAYPGPSGFLLKADNLSGLANTTTARTNLGLGSAAVEPATKLVPAGGTTGQVLGKLSNGDWDDSWITLPSAPVTSVAGRTGAISLANTDISGLGTMSTANAANYSTTSAANLLYYPLSSNPAGYLTSAPVTSVAGRTGAISLAVADVSGAAPLASPALSGTPTAPTATLGTNTTQIATTAFVLANAPAAPVTSVAGKTGVVTLVAADVSGAAPLASPSLTGTPLSTTAAVDTNTTQIATTAFVLAQAASATPLADGTAAVGTSTRYARADHIHPTDTTRAALASPTFTGTPTAPTATGGTNTTQIATTAFVAAAIPTNNVKAWVNFNGTGTVAIRASMNVSSITDNGTGDYIVNFSTALTDANYALTVSNPAASLIIRPFVYATGSCRILSMNTSGAQFDETTVNAVFTR
jgi:hypothetical protein